MMTRRSPDDLTIDERVAARTLLEQLIAFLEWERLYARDLRYDAEAVAAEYGPRALHRRRENQKRLKRMRWAEENGRAA